MRKQLLFSLLVAGKISFAQMCFTATNYTTGPYCRAVACADFDSDGKRDLVSTGQPSNGVLLFKGNGSGGFALPTLADSSTGESMVTADFNADGKADIAMVKGSCCETAVLFGNGSGHFPTMNLLSSSYHPEVICTADFNGDGKPDIATGNDDNVFGVSVYMNNGGGNFTALNLNYGASGVAMSITAGDFNGDSKLDIAALYSQWQMDSLNIFPGDGLGGFGAPHRYKSRLNSASLCSKDFNGDGFEDLAVAEGNGLSPCMISIWLSQGMNGTLAVQDTITFGDIPYSVVSEDFNQDGKNDLAMAPINSGNVSLFAGNGSGGFGTATTFSASASHYAMISSDINADGYPDLATANDGDVDGMSVFLNCSAVGIASLDHKTDLHIYPNPASGIVTIKSDDVIEKLEISNALGEVIYKARLNSEKTTFRFEAPGMYLVKITSGKTEAVRKILVN